MKAITNIFAMVIVSQTIYVGYVSGRESLLDYLQPMEEIIIDEITLRSLADEFKKSLENLKIIMKTGNQSLGIPVLDPYHIDIKEFAIKNDVASVEATIKDLQVEGLANYVVRNADFKLGGWKATVELLWPSISTSVSYSFSGNITGGIFIYGEGVLNVVIQDFVFGTMAKLKLNNKEKRLKVQSLNDTIVSMENLKFEVTGVMGNSNLSEFISEQISTTVPDFLADKDNQEVIIPEINKLLVDSANAILKDVTVDLGSIIG